ncbi:MAG: class I SAM-dependent methyltransferase, partial [Caldiserica bacterium]|nr:class I SAM-dependent methyltransferase [Caldisericota bacterium]
MKQKQQKPLHAIFTDIPPHYDLINHIATLGLDTRWRNALARKCLENNPAKMLDLCCGTGDLALTVAKFSKGSVEITGLDFSKEMLGFAAGKAQQRNITSINFVYGDASEMPFDDGTFEYELDGPMTSSMSTGQYFVVVQHPMNNDEFDIIVQG